MLFNEINVSLVTGMDKRLHLRFPNLRKHIPFQRSDFNDMLRVLRVLRSLGAEFAQRQVVWGRELAIQGSSG
jgi:hypothetical protein